MPIKPGQIVKNLIPAEAVILKTGYIFTINQIFFIFVKKDRYVKRSNR